MQGRKSAFKTALGRGEDRRRTCTQLIIIMSVIPGARHNGGWSVQSELAANRSVVSEVARNCDVAFLAEVLCPSRYSPNRTPIPFLLFVVLRVSTVQGVIDPPSFVSTFWSTHFRTSTRPSTKSKSPDTFVLPDGGVGVGQSARHYSGASG